jgi:hypothetical protein
MAEMASPSPAPGESERALHFLARGTHISNERFATADSAS